MTTPGPDELDAAALEPRVPCGDPEHCASHGECIDYGDELAAQVAARPAPTAQPPVAGDELDDAVRIVENAIDATSDEWTDEDGRRVSSPSDRTGRAVVDALLEAGWQPPDDIVAHAILLDGHLLGVNREHPGTLRGHGITVRPLTYRRVW